MANAKDCHILINYFLSAYEDKYGRKPVVNRNIARWGMDNILYDLTMVEVKDLIDYYMKINASHHNDIKWFYNNYEKLVEAKRERDADREMVNKLKEETLKRTEEWRKRGNSRRETD